MSKSILRNGLPRPLALEPLPLGSITPRGWLLSQLTVEAKVTARLGDVWPSVGPESGWLGGDGEDWERGPYYLDGFLPLAHMLRDEAMISQVNKWVEWTLRSQSENGQFGPRSNDDWWPRMVMLKVLKQHHEATRDPRVVPFMLRYFQYQAEELPRRPFHKWAIARGGENLYAIQWLYDQTGETYLLDLADEVRRQTADWTTLFTKFPYRSRLSREQVGMDTHVVNNAMAVKTPALLWRQWGQERDLIAVDAAIQNLMLYHGQAQGMFSGDELLAGLHPSQGVETCAVAEYMFSLENLLWTIGKASYADILEKVAYNALPAAFTDDMWGHQYDQQPNQVLCTLAKRDWTWNGNEANLFGLEPNFGCCTANFHQAWPKLAGSLWAATPDGGLAAVAYAPCEVSTVVGGGLVTVHVDTSYPFDDTVTCRLSLAGPARFPIRFRIPDWCRNASFSINGMPVAGLEPEAGAFCNVDRVWWPDDRIELQFPMPIFVKERPVNGARSVERGPLVYSLAISTAWSRQGTGPAPLWEVYPTSPWNYGLIVDCENPESSFSVVKGQVGDPPFAAAHPPISLSARGRRIPDWELERNSAATPPVSPVSTDTPVEDLALIPYGSAKLRITEFPVIGD